MADPEDILPGEFVFTVGSPLLLKNSIAHGIVSHPRRTIDGNTMLKIPADQHPNMTYIQSDLAGLVRISLKLFFVW